MRRNWNAVKISISDKGCDVVDNDGNRIGDLYEIAGKAVEAWEALLADFGLLQNAINGT